MTKLAVAFHNFAIVLIKQLHLLIPIRSRDFSPKLADRLWGLPNLLFNGYHGSFRRVGRGRGVKATV
jgi:hypothetical protein